MVKLYVFWSPMLGMSCSGGDDSSSSPIMRDFSGMHREMREKKMCGNGYCYRMIGPNDKLYEAIPSFFCAGVGGCDISSSN